MKIVLALVLLIGGAVALAACSPLRTYDLLVPKDQVASVVRGIAYGDHPRQRLDIYRPEGEGPFPVAVFVHGGSWATGDRAGYSWAGRALACSGFLTVVPSYRLVPEGRYPGFVEDTAAAIAWAYRNAADQGGNPAKLAAIGHSAGAYNVAQAVMAPEFLAAEGLAPGIVGALVSLSGPVDFLPLDTSSTIAAFGHVDELPATQPVNRPEGARPTLAIHGTADETVKPRHATALVEAVRAAGKRAELVLYDGVDHRGVVLGLSRPFRERVPTLRDTVRFLSDTLDVPGARSC